jgi:hypothetical protein
VPFFLYFLFFDAGRRSAAAGPPTPNPDLFPSAQRAETFTAQVAAQRRPGIPSPQFQSSFRSPKAGETNSPRSPMRQLSYPQGETANILRELLGYSGSRMARALTGLVEAGRVEVTPPIRGRHGAVGYRLTSHSRQDDAASTSDLGPRTSNIGRTLRSGPDRTPITHPGGEVVRQAGGDVADENDGRG